jgi:hypothetical protein
MAIKEETYKERTIEALESLAESLKGIHEELKEIKCILRRSM